MVGSFLWLQKGGEGLVANEKNLIPFTERTESEQRKIAHKGGKASGIARRRKRSMREAADLYLSLPVTDGRRAGKLRRRQIDPEDIDNQMLMIVGLVDAAATGDARAARVVLDMLGDDPGQVTTDAPLSALYAALESEEGVDTDAD